MTSSRFKIDFYDSSSWPFGLYVLRPATWWRPAEWKHVDHFQSRDDAKALYEKIKDLPEYMP